MQPNVAAGGFDFVPVVLLFAVLGVMFLPILFARTPEQPESDGDEDSGGGPRRSPSPPEPPIGGIPLPDAEQSPARRRDRVHPLHESRKRRRRLTPHPDRAPTRSPSPR